MILVRRMPIYDLRFTIYDLRFATSVVESFPRLEAELKAFHLRAKDFLERHRKNTLQWPSNDLTGGL
jgi:hypothetical protein